MTKKFIYLLLIILLLLTGCAKEEEKEYTSMDVAGAIADITSDEEGNVLIKLIDGRMFTLGNLKGEKGDQGEKGEQGEQGEPGKNGLNSKNGEDGKDSYGNITIEIKPDQIIDQTNETLDDLRDLIENR